MSKEKKENAGASDVQTVVIQDAIKPIKFKLITDSKHIKIMYKKGLMVDLDFIKQVFRELVGQSF